MAPFFSVLKGSSPTDRKSTRLNSSHLGISYAVFCLKKKKTASAVYDRCIRHICNELDLAPSRLSPTWLCNCSRYKSCHSQSRSSRVPPSFFFNDTATTEIYTLSLHDALPIFRALRASRGPLAGGQIAVRVVREQDVRSEEHTSELQSLRHLVCRLLLEKK